MRLQPEPLYMENELSVDNDGKISVTLTLSTFYYTDELGTKGGTLTDEAAYLYLKRTDHGHQPDLSNLGISFTPDTKFDEFKDLNLSVVVPSLKSVSFKHNKFSSRKRKMNPSMPLVFSKSVRTADVGVRNDGSSSEE